MIDPEKVYHISPNNDTHPHKLHCLYPAIGDVTCSCMCHPRIEEDNGFLFVIHNSFDGREGVEWAKEILDPSVD